MADEEKLAHQRKELIINIPTKRPINHDASFWEHPA